MRPRQLKTTPTEKGHHRKNKTKLSTKKKQETNFAARFQRLKNSPATGIQQGGCQRQ